MEAISHAGTVLGVLAKDGVVLAAEKKVTGKLLDLSAEKDGNYGGSGEKIFLLNRYALRSYISPYGLQKVRYQQCRRWSRGVHCRCDISHQLRAYGCTTTLAELQ